MNAALTTSKTLRTGDDGDLEKRCGRCLEWWPADREFYFPAKDGRTLLQSWCKACYAEERNAKRAAERAGRQQCAP